MPVEKKITTESDFYEDGIISDQVKDYTKAPYFVMKNEDAKEFLRKHPIPDWILKTDDKK